MRPWTRPGCSHPSTGPTVHRKDRPRRCRRRRASPVPGLPPPRDRVSRPTRESPRPRGSRREPGCDAGCGTCASCASCSCATSAASSWTSGASGARARTSSRRRPGGSRPSTARSAPWSARWTTPARWSCASPAWAACASAAEASSRARRASARSAAPPSRRARPRGRSGRAARGLACRTAARRADGRGARGDLWAGSHAAHQLTPPEGFQPVDQATPPEGFQPVDQATPPEGFQPVRTRARAPPHEPP